LNRLANKYEIPPEGVNCLSDEISREFLTAGHLFFLRTQCQDAGHGILINTTKSEKTQKVQQIKVYFKKSYQSA